jgi:hypothetical protein
MMVSNKIMSKFFKIDQKLEEDRVIKLIDMS